MRNSWGPSFGEDGYIRLKMGSNLCNIADGPTATSTRAGPSRHIAETDSMRSPQIGVPPFHSAVD